MVTPGELDSQVYDAPSARFGDGPHRCGQSGLLQSGSGADCQRSGVEALHGVDRRDPLGRAAMLAVCRRPAMR
jgi:hypothetical protein